MRIAGGVLVLIAGLWCMVGGSCDLMAGGLQSAAGGLGGALAKGVGDAQTNMTPEQKAQWEKGMKDLKKAAGGSGTVTMIAGVLTIVGGILCIVAGILFLVNKGKVFAFISIAVALVGIALTFMSPINIMWSAMTKIVMLVIGGVGATKIGAQA